MKKLAEKEQQGIKAIQYLQSLVEITESDEDALNGWRSMTPYEKKNTMTAYSVLCGGK